MSMRKKCINRTVTNTYAVRLKSISLKLGKAPQRSWLCHSMDISSIFLGSLGLSVHVCKSSIPNRSYINLYDQYLDIPKSLLLPTKLDQMHSIIIEETIKLYLSKDLMLFENILLDIFVEI